MNPHEKIRNQHVSVTVSVPVGKSVKISKELHPVDGKLDETKNYNWWEMPGKLWTMTKNGLVCPECEATESKPIGQEVHEAVKQALEENVNAVEEVKERINDKNQN